jgi:hypothetical protein
MKQIFAFLMLITLTGLACAQPPARQKNTSAVVNSQSSGPAGAVGNTSNAPNRPVQPGNANVSPQTNNAVPNNRNSQGRKVCRTVGSTAYYCL